MSTVNRGTQANDPTADTLYDAFGKVNDKFDAVDTGVHINAATAKVTPADADAMSLQDSDALNVRKKITWSGIKVALKTYFDTLYGNLQLGTTSATAHRGDYGTTAYNHSQVTGTPHVSATEKTTWNAKEPALDADQKRKITYGTAAPSGGADGDIYMQYE